MGYKKSWTRTETTQPTLATIKAHIQKLYDEFLLAGLTQTTDTGQMNIGAMVLPPLTPMVLQNYFGFLMFKVFDGVYLKMEPVYRRYNSVSSFQGYLTYEYTIGLETDGKGSFIGNKFKYNDKSANPPSYGIETINTAWISHIYRSATTFWVVTELNRTATNAQFIPTMALMINLTTDETLTKISDVINVYPLEYLDTWSQNTAPMGSLNKTPVVSFNKEPLDSSIIPGLLTENSVLHDAKYDAKNTAAKTYIFKVFNPVHYSVDSVNFDLLYIPISKFTNHQEFQVKNGGTVPRTFIAFSKTPANVSSPFKLHTSFTTHTTAFIWD